jgi:hypothetical protein
MHEFIIFPPYSHSYILSLYPTPFHYCQPLRQDLFCLPGFHFWKKNFLFI